MVVKRIASCLAMVSIVLLMSCYDVQLDKDSSADGNWAENLTTEEIVTWMPVTAEPAAGSSKADETEVEISWECPISASTWDLGYSVDGINFDDLETVTQDSETVSKADPDTTQVIIYRTPCYILDKVQFYLYKAKCKLNNPDANMIHYYKILMPNNNLDGFYWTIVSFVVYPQDRTLRITLADSEADLASDLYCNFASGALFTNINQIPLSYVEKSLGAYKFVTFSIKTDLTSIGYNKRVTHCSGSSNCYVTLEPTNKITGRDVEATLKYNFEDLPCWMKKAEPLSRFDYNDVVFTVDIIDETN